MNVNINDLRSNSSRGFTLIELLVVIAVISVLAGMMLPALATPKSRSAAAGCLGNLRQLQNAWAMYLDDNNDVMLPNAPLGQPANESWCASINGENWTISSDNTNFLVTSLIGPYISNNLAVLKCPADVVPSLNGQRVRSYSMNGQMGAIYTGNIATEYNPGFLIYINGSDLTCPTPASAFIFLDEHPGSINDGFFQVSSAEPIFPDVPASYMEGGCGFSFADGHGEIHQWQTTNLMIPVLYGVSIHEAISRSSNPDWLWFTTHAACPQ